MQRLILIILSTFAFLATPAFAKGSDTEKWIVSQRSGDARVVRSGLQPASLMANAALAPGDIVTTGPTGRATLARGSDYIVVAPRSELRLPATPQQSGFTRVVQTLGTMLFKVRHTGTPHFAVDTPMLAAVVKGTTFTIVVDKDRSAVQVIEGAVEVTATDGGMQGLVEGGKTIFIDHRDPKRLIVANARTLGGSRPATDTSVKINGSEGEPLSAIVKLTSGLVRAEAAPISRVEAPVAVAAVVTTTAPTDQSGSTVQPAPGTTTDSPTGTVAPITKPIVGTLPVVDAVVTPIVDPLPVVDDVVTPVVAPDVDAIVTPVAPVIDAVVPPIVDAVVTPVAPVIDAVVVPVVDAVVAPIVTPVVDVPIVDAVVTPVVDAVVVPVVDPVLVPVVDAVVVPVIDAVVAPVVVPVIDAVVTPILAPVVDAVVAPVIDAVVVPVIDAVVAPVVVPVIDAVVAPVVVPIVDAVVVPVVDAVVVPVVDAVVVPVVDAVVAPITGLLGGLLGGL